MTTTARKALTLMSCMVARGVRSTQTADASPNERSLNLTLATTYILL